MIDLSEHYAHVAFGHGTVGMTYGHIPEVLIENSICGGAGYVELSDITDRGYSLLEEISEADQASMKSNPVRPVQLHFENVESVDLLLDVLGRVRNQMIWGQGSSIEKS